MTNTTNRPDLDLDAIEQRANAATPGPWEEHPAYGPHFYANVSGPYLRGVGTLNFGDGEDAEADREFVKHAREDVDAMAAEIRRLRAELAQERENYQAYRIGAEGAKRMAANRINAVTDLLDQQELAARAFEVPVPEWVTVVRRAAGVVVPAASEETAR